MKLIDAAPLDTACILSGAIYYIVSKLTKKYGWFDSRLLPDLLNGLAIPPIVLLMLSAEASWLLDALKASGRLTLLYSGACALIAIFDPRRTGLIKS
jgi:hypothetical protein